MSEPQFLLDSHERTTGLWLKLKGHLEARLQRARVRNDGNLSPDETALVRGEIKALKGLLALGSDELPPIPTAVETRPTTTRAWE